MVASILPEHETCVSPKELEKKRLNAVVTNLLCSCVCRELKHLILKSNEISEDAHLIWELSYGPPWAHYLGGYQDRLLGGPLGLPGLRYTALDGVEHKDYGGEVLG
jgi:hypothetical protein